MTISYPTFKITWVNAIIAPVLDSIRKTIRKVAPGTKATNDEIYQIVIDEIIKRDVLDDEKATEAKKMITKALNKIEKQKATPTSKTN